MNNIMNALTSYRSPSVIRVTVLSVLNLLISSDNETDSEMTRKRAGLAIVHQLTGPLSVEPLVSRS